MTIEEKAKAYDNALEVLEKYKDAHIMLTYDLKVEMFPELAETEDERIRKWLIDWTKACENWSKQFSVTREQVLAWLEKHKNCEAEIEKAYKNSDEVQYRKGYEDGVASVKQEWSEEDNKIMKQILAIIKEKAFADYEVEVDGTLCGSCAKLYSWLKSLTRNTWS